jgi:hypothetical protein
VWTPLRAIDLKHLRQIRTLRAARIIHIAGGFLRAIGGQLIEPIDHLGITAAGGILEANEASVRAIIMVIREDIATWPFLTSGNSPQLSALKMC